MHFLSNIVLSLTIVLVLILKQKMLVLKSPWAQQGWFSAKMGSASVSVQGSKPFVNQRIG